MEFECDKDKAASNEKKHGITFSEATTIFGDPLELAISDPEHHQQSIDFSASANPIKDIYWWYRIPRDTKTESASSAPEKPPGRSSNIMNKATEEDEMRSEYDFSDGIRGKHYRAYRQGTNMVFLEPDIAEIFKDSESVNHALRMLIKLAGRELSRNETKDSNQGL